jgi:DNA-binding transcriptional ArsR family regulator
MASRLEIYPFLANDVNRERDSFGLALSSLREQLRCGAHGQGQPLAIGELARVLGLSPTPVREALSRLAGEGLVEDYRGRGFFSRRLDAGELAELYDLQHLQQSFALRTLVVSQHRPAHVQNAPADGQSTAPGDDLGGRCEMVLERIVRASRLHDLWIWHGATANRLGPARRMEVQMLGDVAGEIQRLERLSGDADWAGLREELRRFHKRRRLMVNELATALRSPMQS